jgi:hypothetical protein
MVRELEPPATLEKQLVGARAVRALEIPDVDHEGEILAIDLGDQVGEARFLVAVVRRIAERGEGEWGGLLRDGGAG